MGIVIKLAGKIIVVICGDDFNFRDDEVLRRAMLFTKNCFEFDGPYINGVYLVTFRSVEDDEVLERRVAEVITSYERGEL